MERRPLVAAAAGRRGLTSHELPATEGVATRLQQLRDVRGEAAVELCAAVRDLVVVCSSSRGGSSLFGELLRRSGALLTFSAEINPHVTIPTLGSGGGCDVVADPAPFTRSSEGLAVLQGELGNDLGRPASELEHGSFIRHVTWRLTMQWPAITFDLGTVADWVDQAMAALGCTGRPPEPEPFLLALLPLVMRAHPQVNPYRYDLADDVVARRFPHVAVPQGPTAEPVVEMAPFVLPRAWRVADRAEAAARPVLATTPRNAFRLPLLQRAFPNARLRVVHLTRNPAASVNGLRDGWLHRGFFSCRSDEPLDIAGYSDVVGPWGRWWWNYDVPPGWRNWTARPLVDVCGFQWRAAHEATIASAEAIGADRFRVAFEDVINPDSRGATLTALARWLEIDPAPLADHAGDLPVVMPTAAPRRRRWEANAAALEPVLTDPEILATARMLGYSDDPRTWE